LQDVRSLHQVTAPVIDLLDADHARGVWAMFDWLEFPEGHRGHRGHPNRFGYGYYEEEYRREDGRWRISLLRLTRIRNDRFAPGVLVSMDDLGMPADPSAFIGPRS
jgi:hypothetical protein